MRHLDGERGFIMQDYRHSAAPCIKEWLNYHESIRGHAVNTVDSYYFDIKLFIGWLNSRANPDDPEAIHNEMISVEQLAAVRKTDIYEYLTWLNRDRHLDSSSRARHLSAIKSLFYYLAVSTEQIPDNPTIDITPPKIRKSLPVYLTESQAENLLQAPSGKYELRDRAILMLFMACGLRISELAGLNLDRITNDSIRVLGKGNKERVIYLSEAMRTQLRLYLDMRYGLSPVKGHENAVFLSNRNTRISVRRIQSMVDEKLRVAGLDSSTYSPHKLRHTAATLMLQNGVDIRVLQEILGHERLDTTQIYTHVDDTDLRLAAEASPIGKKKK